MDKILASPDALVDFYQNFETNKAALYARAEATVYKQQLEALRTGQIVPGGGRQGHQPNAYESITEDHLRNDLKGSLEDVFESEEFKSVFQPADRERITGRLGDMVTRGLYFQAERDFTEEELKAGGFDVPGGLEKGAVVLNEQALLRELQYEASLIKQYRAEAQKQAKEAQEARDFNAKRGVPTGKAAPVAPKSPPPSVSATTPAPSTETAPAKNYDEWAKKMGLYQ
jgi:hypothetical protein